MEFLCLVVALTRVGHKVIGLQSPEELERQVATRTAELARANDALRAEVEQRLRVEQTLLKEQERFRLTLASIGDGVLATDALGRVNFLNGVACSLTGWTLRTPRASPSKKSFASSRRAAGGRSKARRRGRSARARRWPCRTAPSSSLVTARSGPSTTVEADP